MSPRLSARNALSFLLMCAPPPYRQHRVDGAMLNALIIQISSIFEPESEGLFHIRPFVDGPAVHDDRVHVRVLLLLSLGGLVLLHSCSPFFTPIVAGVRLCSPAFVSIVHYSPLNLMDASKQSVIEVDGLASSCAVSLERATVHTTLRRESTMIRLRVKEVAQAKGITQGKLQRMADMDIKTIRKIYRNPYTIITTETLARLAEALGVPSAELIEDERSEE